MMANKNTKKAKIGLDPGNALIIVYVGFILFVVFLAMMLNNSATVTSINVPQKELLLGEIGKVKNLAPTLHLFQDMEIYGAGRTIS